MSETHCDQCGGPFSSAHSDTNLRTQLAAKDAEIAALRERVDELQTAMLSPIACDVTLPPATTFRKGVSFATLMAGINQRAALEMSGGVK